VPPGIRIRGIDERRQEWRRCAPVDIRTTAATRPPWCAALADQLAMMCCNFGMACYASAFEIMNSGLAPVRSDYRCCGIAGACVFHTALPSGGLSKAAMAELRGLEPLTSSMPSTVGTREHLSCSGQTVLRCTWRSVCTEAVGKQFGKRCLPFSLRRLRPLSWLPMLRTTTCRAGQTLAGDREPQPICPALSSLASRPRQRSSRHYLPSQWRAR
jgi:hypothetical protein